MKINIHNILPEELSDESAYHLVNFLANLTAELESYYFAEMQRYINNSMPVDLPNYLNDQLDNQKKQKDKL